MAQRRRLISTERCRMTLLDRKISMLPEKYSSNPTDTQNIGLRSGGVVGRLRVNSWLMNKNRTYAPDPPVSPSGALHR